MKPIRIAVMALFCVLMGCAGPADEPESGALEEAGEEVSERTQAVTTEPFGCFDRNWETCQYPWRTDNRWTRFVRRNGSGFDVHPYGESGENYSDFNIRNFGTIDRFITYQTTIGGVGWYFQFAPGDTCNTYGHCKVFVCWDEGIPWPRCHESLQMRGSTYEFTGERIEDEWEPHRIRVYLQIIAGPAVSSHVTWEEISIWHTPI